MFVQLRQFRTPLLVVCLVLAALLLYTAQLRRRQPTALWERGVLRIAAPFQQGLDAVIEGVAEGWGHYLWLVGTRRENDQLRQVNRQLQAELLALEEVRLANDRLRQLLNFRETLAAPALPAEVIGEDASSWFRTVLINKGRDDGVREGLPVVAAEGVVGRVIRCGGTTSRVLLISDASSAVAALVQSSRTRGVVRGRGDVLTLEFALRQKELALGDRVVTSGTGGVFPRGLPIGEISEVTRGAYGLFQGVTVVPSVDFSRLEEVLVLLEAQP